MLLRTHILLGSSSLLALVLLPVRPAAGQTVVSFFNGAPTGVEPQIRTVFSGAITDATAVVSQDRKYVTITARPRMQTLIAINNFTFSGAQQGFVGGVGVPPVTPGQANNGPLPALPRQPDVLDHGGVTLLRALPRE